ncbi:MAG: hypothetical protein JSW10_04105 [Pseudomonadota bacterium]|nr:MAG: hypothetical protein JSW10_04105 [Pseudomonadota bacterium]
MKQSGLLNIERSAPRRGAHLEPAEPLWQRVPTRDDNGDLLTDFMMLIPRLGSKPQSVLDETIHKLQQVLALYENIVVFADLNLKLNVLWVSTKSVPGICLELPAAIKMKIPEALLVAQGQQS